MAAIIAFGVYSTNKSKYKTELVYDSLFFCVWFPLQRQLNIFANSIDAC
jgi:hypothetical protein